MERKLCRVCALERPVAAFPANRHAPDGSGRASLCLDCLAGGRLDRELRAERARDAYQADPLVARRRELRAELAALKEDLERTRAAQAAIRQQARDEQEAFLALRKPCTCCGQSRLLVDFPRNKYNMLEGEGGRSRICSFCYSVMPDGKKVLARERARDWHRVMYNAGHAKALMMEESSRKYRARVERHNTVKDLEALLGVDGGTLLDATPAERRVLLAHLMAED